MKVIDEARRVLAIEAKAIELLSKSLDDSFEKAIDILIACKGKIVISGIGKSGHIAVKIASTLSSTGSPSMFVHPSECSHGDLGVISSNDVAIVISNGGNTAELTDLLAYLTRKGIPLISITSNMDSQLAQAGSVVLSIKTHEEACPMGLAPTTSTTVSLALGDAIAMSLLKKRGFKEEDYAEFHPGGSLGRRLLTRVSDVMHTGESLPLVKEDELMKDVIAKMTAKEVRGVAGVIDSNDRLVGIVTDGDIRRRLEKSQNPLSEKASDLMSRSPKTVRSQEMAEKALFMMEQFQIQTLFVMSEETGKLKPVGILHLQDLLKAKIR